MDCNQLDPIEHANARAAAERGDFGPLLKIYIPVFTSGGRVDHVDQAWFDAIDAKAVSVGGLSVTEQTVELAREQADTARTIAKVNKLFRLAGGTPQHHTHWIVEWARAKRGDHFDLFTAFHRIGFDYDQLPSVMVPWVREAMDWRPKRGRKSDAQRVADANYRPWFAARLKHERLLLKDLLRMNRRTNGAFGFSDDYTRFGQLDVPTLESFTDGLDASVSAIQSKRWGLSPAAIEDYTRRNRR